MKNKLIGLLGLTLMLIFCIAFSASAAASYSNYWYQTGDGVWHVKDGSGDTISNCWFCDDAIAANGKDAWYLIDEHGNMVTGGLVVGTDGKYYSLETNHDGAFGKLRTKSGVYDGIQLQLSSSHDGGYASILNSDGIEALKTLYGVKNISIDSNTCLYSAAFSKSAATGPAAAADFNNGTFTYNGKTYVVDYSWGNHYLTGYHDEHPTTSGSWPVANHTISGPRSMLGKIAYVHRISGARGSEYDGIYVFEDTGGPAVETGLDRTMGVPVVDIYFNSDAEAEAVTAPGWTTAEVFILKEK